MLGAGHLAPAVVDFLLFRQRIMNAREELDILVENQRQRPRRRLAFRALGVGQQVQRGLKVQLFLFACNAEHQPRHGFIEQLVPRRCAHDGFVMQEGFQFVRQLVRTHGAHAVEHRLIAGEGGVFCQQPVQMRILQPVELKAEEHQGRR